MDFENFHHATFLSNNGGFRKLLDRILKKKWNYKKKTFIFRISNILQLFVWITTVWKKWNWKTKIENIFENKKFEDSA